jgi:RNase P subunit RPR2
VDVTDTTARKMNKELEERIKQLAKAAADYDRAHPDEDHKGFKAGVDLILQAYERRKTASAPVTASIPCNKCGNRMGPADDPEECTDERPHSHWLCDTCGKSSILVIDPKIPTKLSMCVRCQSVLNPDDQVFVADDGIQHLICPNVPQSRP